MDPGLDFSSLLGLAEHVSKDKASSRPQYLKTKFDGPKKEKKDKGKLSENVKKFLEKKEAETKAKEAERIRNLKNLQELRSEREKNKIAKHLKVTKSANKAVISEAVNKRDTAHTMNGRTQCDEDDYGFTSNMSNSIYEKLMGKYEATPDDPMAKFSKSKPKSVTDINSAKERVKQALRKEEEEPVQRRRKRKGGGGGDDNDPGDDTISYSRVRDDKEFRMESMSSSNSKEDKTKSQKQKEKEEAIKRRKEMAKKAPKPMDFESLLQMAKIKKDQPVVVEKKKKDIKEFDFGDRPMTKKQKEEYIRENEAKLRREGKIPPKESNRIPKLSSSGGGSSSSADKPTAPSPSTKSSTPPSSRSSASPVPTSGGGGASAKVRRPDPGPSLHPAVLKSMKKMEQSSRKDGRDGERRDQDRGRNGDQDRGRNGDSDRGRNGDSDRGRNGDSADSKKFKEEHNKLKEQIRKQEEERRKMEEKMKELEARLSGGSKNGSKQSSGSSSSSKSDKYDRSDKYDKYEKSDKKRSIHEVESRRFPGEKIKKSKEKVKRNRIESDSEYDSEMDDFIDDSESNFDISKEIRSIFGYDKRKYRDEPYFDDRSMENNKFSSIMQEEVRSAKIGRMEDLEDMRREEMEKRQRLQKMKSSKKR